ncbi:MAG: hypothetical protein JNK58_05055 [Phycisphaerae bacterium]|nr:hypothetical protein [Phycisphaerae bacterium]
MPLKWVVVRGLIALGCFAIMPTALAIGIAVKIADVRMSNFWGGLLGFSGMLSFAAYALIGLIACMGLRRHHLRKSEPEGLREQRRLLLYFVFLLPALWGVIAALGLLAIFLFEPFAVLVLPANGLILGLPMVLWHVWVQGIAASLMGNRNDRRRAARSAEWTAWLLLGWAVLGALACSITYWKGSELLFRTTCAIGGPVYAFIVLRCFLGTWRLLRRLRSFRVSGSSSEQPDTDARL